MDGDRPIHSHGTSRDSALLVSRCSPHVLGHCLCSASTFGDGPLFDPYQCIFAKYVAGKVGKSGSEVGISTPTREKDETGRR